MSVHEDLLNNGENNCSFTEDEVDIMCSKDGDDACGSRDMSTKGEVVKILEFDDCPTNENLVEILRFTHFSRVFNFNKTSEIGRKKEIFHEIKVSVVMELV